MAFMDKMDALCASRELEKKAIEKIANNGVVISFFLITFFAILIRYSVRNFTSGDYLIHLSNWYGYFKSHGGFAALNTTIGDYNIPYQTLVALMAYIDVRDLYQFKFISCLFDFILAVSSGLFVYYVCSKKENESCTVKNAINNLSFVLPYGLILFLPTVVMNSAVWAQCDSMYSAFVILSLFFIFKNNFFLSFIFLGCAFAFKLQAIFILPFFFYLYFRKREFSILFIFFIPLVDIFLSIPSLCMGLPFSSIFNVYVNQTGSYTSMYLNYPSFWALVGDNYEYFKLVAIIITMCILLLGLHYVLLKNIDLSSSENFLSLATWSVWTCVLFLPSMHERYGYLVEILSIIMCITKRLSNNRNGQFVVFTAAFVLQISTCTTYGRFFFNTANVEFGMILIMHVFIYFLFSYYLFSNRILLHKNKLENA